MKPEGMGRRGRVDLRRMAGAYQEGRAGAKEDSTVTVRAVAHIDEDLHMVGRTGRFHIESDEPVARGGSDTSPSPLQYFISGAAF